MDTADGYFESVYTPLTLTHAKRSRLLEKNNCNELLASLLEEDAEEQDEEEE